MPDYICTTMNNPISVIVAARLRGVSKVTILNWCRFHGLQHIRSGRLWIIDRDALMAFTPPGKLSGMGRPPGASNGKGSRAKRKVVKR